MIPTYSRSVAFLRCFLFIICLLGIPGASAPTVYGAARKSKATKRNKPSKPPTRRQIETLRDNALRVEKSPKATKQQKHWAKKWSSELSDVLDQGFKIETRRYKELKTKIARYPKSRPSAALKDRRLLAKNFAKSVDELLSSLKSMSSAQKLRITEDTRSLKKGELDLDRVGHMIKAVDEAIESAQEAENYTSYPKRQYKTLKEDIRPRDATNWVDPKFVTRPYPNTKLFTDIPKDEGATSTESLKSLSTNDLKHRLRLVSKKGKVTMPRRTIPYPWPQESKDAVDPFYGNIRGKEYRKLPPVLTGFFETFFSKETLRKNTQKALELFTPTHQGTYELFADKVQELYPDRPDSPKGKATHLKTYLETIKNAKFVWAHIYQLSNPEIYKALHQKAQRGIPVYLVVGSESDSKQALDYFKSRNSKVKVVTSAQEYQGKDRQFRIDHNKTLFTINKNGITDIIEGGINGGELSSQNIDTSYRFTGGNFGLDVLNNLMFHTLRAEGRIALKDMERLSDEVGRMLNRKKKSTSVELETAVTSSRVVGRGRIVNDASDILTKLKNKRSLVLDGKSALRILEGSDGTPKLYESILGSLESGKHIIFSMDSDMTTRERRRLKKVSKDFKSLGLEILRSSDILVDNSVKNLAHTFVEDAVKEDSNIYTAAFAHSDGTFNKKLVWASKTLHERGSSSQVHVTSPDLHINGVPINQNSTGSLLWAKDAGHFWGTVTGIHKVSGPLSDKTGERKWHSKLLISNTKVMIGSANHSKIGFEASEERGVVIKDKGIAKRVTDYTQKLQKQLIKENGAKELTLDMQRAKKEFEKRPSLTKGIPKKGASLADHVYIIMDLETDGLSQPTDGRITQMAAQAMDMDSKGNLSKSNVGSNVSSDFNQFMSVGKDHYGRKRKLDPRIKKMTNITENMLRYQPEMVDAFNRFNAWVRHVEKTTGKTPILVMHNKNFDHNMYNAWAATEGVTDNPVISEKNVFCTLRAQEKFRVIRSVKEKSPITRRVKLKAAKDSWDEYNGIALTDIDGLHRADVDMGATASVFESQVKYAMKGVRLVEEMQLRDLGWSKNKKELKWARVVKSKKSFFDWSTPKKKTLNAGTYDEFSWLFKSKKSLIDKLYGAVDHKDMTDSQFQAFSRIKEIRQAWSLLKAERAAKENHQDLPKQVFAN